MSIEEKQNFPTFQDSNSTIYPQNEKELSDKVIGLLSDANLRNNMGERGEAVIEANRGSSKKTFELIEKYLNN